MKHSSVTRPASEPEHHPDFAVTPTVVELRELLLSESMRPVAELEGPGHTAQIMLGGGSLWAVIRRPGLGGVALRMAQFLGDDPAVRVTAREKRKIAIELESPIGLQTVDFDIAANELTHYHVENRLTPLRDVTLRFAGRDLFPLDAQDDIIGAAGKVDAVQRGLNVGLTYFQLLEPAFGSVLYLQDLTRLNPYFKATGTVPDAAVGGEWPELGYLPPFARSDGDPPQPLPAGQEVMLSCATLVVRDYAARDENQSALQFLQMLAQAYRRIEHPTVEFRNWVERAERTIRDLESSPKATIRHYDHLYVHPYTASEYPDAMVQMATIAPLADYAAWCGKPLPLLEELSAGLDKFYDRRRKTMRRYLPNVGKDKDKYAVDSWYLYHPLLNLGRLALDGHARARRLFLGSLPFAIKAAQHFEYHWPIQYDIRDFSLITAARNDDGLGQTDVGGIYAYVMLQAHALTEDPVYLEEAKAAFQAARGMRFDLNYQANLTAWGAAAALRLWRITNDLSYLEQCYVYLASFFHNCEIWESDLGHAEHYKMFMGATCLHDAPYMAVYECYDSYAAFEQLLKDSGPDFDPAAEILVNEYCRYATDRAWFFYPDALPPEMLCEEPRNGHIDRTLSFPLEDLSGDGQIAGQVGQEIYGAGAAFVFASRTSHRVSDAPFFIYCDHFMLASDRSADHTVSFKLSGTAESTALLCLVRTGREKLPEVELFTEAGERQVPTQQLEDRLEFLVPANAWLTLRWS